MRDALAALEGGRLDAVAVTPETGLVVLTVWCGAGVQRLAVGVGPRVAEAVEALNLPGVRTLVCQLLSPEHADPIARARRVIFVDAELVPSYTLPVAGSEAANVQLSTGNLQPIRWRKLAPGETSQFMAHAADPRTMLALARDVFGHAPAAWWLTIPAFHLGFGTDYSPAAEAGCQTAIDAIKRLVAGNFREDTPPVVG